MKVETPLDSSHVGLLQRPIFYSSASCQETIDENVKAQRNCAWAVAMHIYLINIKFVWSSQFNIENNAIVAKQ